jgi:hypothetical protein
MVFNRRYPLPAGSSLTVSVVDGSAHVQQEEDPAIAALVTNARSVSFGPYNLERAFRVQDGGNVSVTIAEVVPDAMPLVGLAGDVVEIVGAAAPTASAQASLTVNPAGDENGLIFTAVEYGVTGNDISIAYVHPDDESAPLSVSVSGKAITVSLETDPAAEIVSTAAEVLAAIEAHARADELVSVVIHDADGGDEDDGSGVVTVMARANLAGGAGTGVGFAGPGSRYTDTDTPALYINTGTKAQPVWAALAEVA